MTPMNFSGIFSQIFGQAAEHLPIDDPEMAQAVRLISKVQMHLQSTWRHAQRTGIHCEQQVRSPHGETLRCVEGMSGTCIACRRPVCLYHSAMVPENGDLLCFGCVGAAQRAARETASSSKAKDYNEPPPGRSRTETPSSGSAAEDTDKLRKKFLRRLKLTANPTEAEIKSAFKREAAKAHPDKAPAGQRDKAHEKFVSLGEARDWLLADLQRREAA